MKLNSKAKKIKLDNRSKSLRKIIIKCLNAEGRGHLGPAYSCLEIIRVIYDKFIKKKNSNKFILSKGHGCLALYSLLYDKKYISKKQIMDIGKLNSILAGHPEHTIPGVDFSTGSLGHGLSLACGVGLAYKIKKKYGKIFVLLGDGELSEGSVWEALLSISKHSLKNIIILIDYNKFQAYDNVSKISNIKNLHNKFKSFGFNVFEINGHDIKSLINCLNRACLKSLRPNVIICHTIKGKGFSKAEGNVSWHHKSKILQADILEMEKELN